MLNCVNRILIIAHNLGSGVGRLETAAYATIEKDYEEKRKLKSAQRQDVQEKRQADYTHAIALAEIALTLYDDFS
jgi:hypothetical protein